MESKVKIGGIIQNGHLTRISVMGVPDQPGTAAALLTVFAEAGLNVQFIVQCIDQHGHDHIALCVDRHDLEIALRLACAVQARLGGSTVSHDAKVATLGIYGPDFRERPGIAGTFFRALSARDIGIQAISTSLSTVMAVISSDRLKDGIAAVQEAFELP